MDEGGIVMKDKINEIVDKVKNDKDFAKKFSKEPIKAVEEVVGVDLPDDQINKIIDTVKAKINVDKGISKITGLFK
jgi:uncharacterized protein YpuA (DUF1002 family)